MNQEPSPQLPKSTCAYERYDSVTLEPENKETFVRLQELGWSAGDFKGRNVLDIGCNSGLLTIHALKLGAAHVHACDVQPPLVEFVRRVVAAHQLPVTVDEIAFHKLDPSKDKADVVLFMEVLHWAVSQGLELRTVIQRLADLTGHLLYIEFPWSVKEPSIQKQTKLTEETYSADAVLDELTRYFSHVRIVRFMRYFGFASPSQRILIEARDKRPEASILAQLPGVYSLDVALSRGRNQSYLLTGAAGPLVAKLLARESFLTRLPQEVLVRMFDELSATPARTVVLPKKQSGRYVIPTADGGYWMLFPFVGRFPTAGKARPYRFDENKLIDLFIDARRDLRRLQPSTLELLKKQHLLLNVKDVLESKAWKSAASRLAHIGRELEAVLGQVLARYPACLDAICHGDLQIGNVILGDDGHARIVDLDNLLIGTIYSDGITGLIWRGASAEVLSRFCAKLASEESRSAARHDAGLAIANALAWCASAMRSEQTPLVDEQMSRLRVGLEQALQFASSLPTD